MNEVVGMMQAGAFFCCLARYPRLKRTRRATLGASVPFDV